MTDQSRVEAVRAALRWARYRGLSIDDELTAQAAIEASDAWLVEQVAAQADKQIADRHEPEDTDR